MTEINITQVIIAIIGSGALSAVISGLFQVLAKKNEKKSASGKALLALLWDSTDSLGQRYIEEGSITADELHRILTMFEAYKGLGGNGYMDTLIDNVKRLPISNQ